MYTLSFSPNKTIYKDEGVIYLAALEYKISIKFTLVLVGDYKILPALGMAIAESKDNETLI
jgi:hypothetical protein